MIIDIGKKYLENLIEKRALVRQAMQKHSSNEFSLFVLDKEGSVISVSECSKVACYECASEIKKGDGLKLKITEKKGEGSEEYCFHKYHF